MGKPTGFLEYPRREVGHRPVPERLGDWREIELPLPTEELARQAARCMDCGIPFCHGVEHLPGRNGSWPGAFGCPLGNRMPEFNDLVYRGRWREAAEILHATNNFPEITGRVCPAPCEASCTLNINDDPVLIRHIERQIAERAFAEGWIRPAQPLRRTGRKVAVIGSGPAGLAAAQQLARAGHDVVVFEKADRIGGLLRYGIPDFKLEKRVLDRRLEQLAAEGIDFQTGVVVGEDISGRYLRRTFDAICLAMGAGQPRDLNVPGRELDGIHFAMEFLSRQNRINAGLEPEGPIISAHDKVVVVIGGGDTGSDCVGTARRQGAREVHQFEILPQPPEGQNPNTPWPAWPQVLRTTSSHEEGCQRRWSVMTKAFSGRDGHVTELQAVEVKWVRSKHGYRPEEIPGTEFTMQVDLVLLAMGFLHVDHTGLIEHLHLELDERGNVAVDEGFMTSAEGIFAAGDTISGASLVVRAIDTGRRAAAAIDRWLNGG